jgi:hypothetical protein
MGVIRLEHSTVVVSLAAVLSMAALPHAQTSTGGLPGRWEFSIDTPAPAAAGARGSGTAAQGPATRTVTLNLTVGAGGTVSGTVAISGSGRGGGPGGNPSRPVEISDGKADKTHVSFSVWQFDGYRNRMRYDGIVEGDRLTLTMTRDTSNGPERIQAVAVRKPY